jgi:hypothetical protein
MAHYAFLDNNNVVTEVITGRNEGELDINWEEYYGNIRKQVCKRTSYHTEGGIHKNGGIPFRKNFAFIGYTYDENRDAFIPPQDYSSWTFNENTCRWDSPIPYPTIITEDQSNPITWRYITYWNENAYQADNTKGWEANKSNDTGDMLTTYEWNGTSWSVK